MPQWSFDPPATPAGLSLRLCRTPAQAQLSGVITTPDLIGCATHFAKNRTVPCEGQDHCQWCADGHSWRWHGYIGVLISATLEHVILELTAAATDPLRNYLRYHQTLRACIIRAFRPSKRFNGRVTIECKAGDERRMRLPDPPDVPRILCHTWGVQHKNAVDLGLNRKPFKGIGILPDPTDARMNTDLPPAG